MKKEIIKHEWVKGQGLDIERCIHCNTRVTRLQSGDLYQKQYKKWETIKEPPCITRKIENDVEGNKK